MQNDSEKSLDKRKRHKSRRKSTSDAREDSSRRRSGQAITTGVSPILIPRPFRAFPEAFHAPEMLRSSSLDTTQRNFIDVGGSARGSQESIEALDWSGSSLQSLCSHLQEADSEEGYCYACHIERSNSPGGFLVAGLKRATSISILRSPSSTSIRSRKSVRFAEDPNGQVSVEIGETYAKEDYPERSALAFDDEESQNEFAVGLQKLMMSFALMGRMEKHEKEL